MRSLFRVSGGAVVILVAAIVNGCGSSPTADQQTASESQVVDEATAKAISSPESPSNAVPFETAGPPSVLEIAKVQREPFVRDEESKALFVTFADLNLKGVLGKELITSEDVKRLPNWLNALNGEKIRIRGFMLPTFEETGIERFVLDHSPRMMNFGADPKTYELIQVDLVAGTTTSSVRAGQSIEVIGRFRINFDAHDGTIPMLYFLDDAFVVADQQNQKAP